MIERILIANRGEIACRIIKTAAKLGIESSVVFSKDDEGSLAVKMADKAFLLADSKNNSQEYLDIEQIIRIAKKDKIEAIHPGYGFLSENANFAKAVEEKTIRDTSFDSSARYQEVCLPTCTADGIQLSVSSNGSNR